MGFCLRLRQYLWPDSSVLKTLEIEINFFDDFQQQCVPSFVMNKMCLKAEINCMQTKHFFYCHTVNAVMYRTYIYCVIVSGADLHVVLIFTILKIKTNQFCKI